MPSADELWNNANYWRERAKRLRAESGTTPNKEETRLLLELAAMHDKFADDIQARQNPN